MTFPRSRRPGVLCSKVRALLLVTFASVLALLLVVAAPAFGARPWWHLGAETVPARVPAGGEGQLVIVASNLGDAPVQAGKEPVSIAIKLPSGLTASSLTGAGCSLSTLTCSFNSGVFNPYERTSVGLKVKAASSGVWPVQASVQGGGAGETSQTLMVTSGEPASFGVEEYALEPFNENGTPATQAGAHPFQLTTTLVLNQTNSPHAGRQPVALPKDFTFNLPAGLVGNPNVAEQCTMANFFALVFETNLCSPGSVVGVATVTADEPLNLKVFSKTVPVFNLVPAHGEPARFGLEVAGKVAIVIDTSVRSGKDYGVDVSVQNATQIAGLLSSQVTLWGVPGDPRHDNARGWECVAGGAFAKQAGRPCPETSGLPEEPFLTLPTSCASDPQTEPVVFPMQADSWAEPTSPLGSEYAWMNNEGQRLGFEGCGELSFEPSIDVVAEGHAASTPTGLDVNVTVPQTGTLRAGGRAEADVRDTTVTLPQGVELSPSAANGLEGCSEAQVGFTGFNQATQTNEFNTSEAACPEGSKVGTVRIKTPLLSHELEGGVYLASPAPNGEAGQNPFNGLVALYIVAEDPVSGVLVKLAGEGHVDEGTLRISTSFKNTPQVPFEELSLKLFGGPRASVSTPPVCGSYPTSALFTPWSSPQEVSVLSPAEHFAINTGAGGSGCPAGLPFTPGFTAYTQNVRAGAFTNFTMELTRPDGDQALKGITMHLPAGIAAMLSTVTPCPEPPQGQQWECGPDSLIGHATAISGLGGKPVTLGGEVFLTSGYDGSPFGILVATRAKAGPFDLGMVYVRSRINVDPNTAAVSITTDPGPRGEAFPTQLRGIPVQLKRIIVSVDREHFEFNPTNCTPMKIEGSISGAQGASADVSSPFQVADCQSLPFHPTFTASTQASTSKANGASLTVKVASGEGQANIGKASVALPLALPSRLTTLQKACTDVAFEANPASCPQASLVGTATVHTPVLSNPLTGPAYLVSHGNAAFPDLEFVLQGEGITLILDGQTNIKKGITTSTFNTLPDAPVSSFETVLPEGPHSVLGVNLPESAKGSLCSSKLVMPTTLTGQNGAVIKQETKIKVEGCHGVKAFKATRAQLLAKALKACRKRYKHSHARRAACERQAHKRYGAKKAVHKHKKTAKRR
jgi:hypothetical protein